MKGIPLSERRSDWFFVAAFSFFIVTSIVTDSVNGLNGSLDPNSAYPVERFIYDSYARVADPLLILNPPQVRVSAWISAFVWLPLYAGFVLAFVKGWNRIRPFGLVYGGALTHGMITYMSQGIFGSMATEGWADAAVCPGCVEPSTWYYLAANTPYLVVPALMIIRMWKPLPFGMLEAEEPEEPAVEEPAVEEPIAEREITIDLRGEEPVVTIGDREVRPDHIVR